MKVFLCKGKRLTFSFPKNLTWERKDAAVWQRLRKGEVNLIITKNDVTSYLDEGSSTQIDWRKQLAKIWANYQPNERVDLLHHRISDMASYILI